MQIQKAATDLKTDEVLVATLRQTSQDIFDESNYDTNDGAAEEDVAGAAYGEALTSADGFTRVVISNLIRIRNEEAATGECG
jgi:hypothetical protein